MTQAVWLGEIIFHFSRFYFIEKSLLGRKVHAQNNNKKKYVKKINLD